jgi:NitT/TauT family transport system permease protein/sulfonate transport system permease protein
MVKAGREVNVRGWAFVVVITGVVELVARFGDSPAYLPPPTTILGALISGLVSGEIAGQAGITLLSYTGSVIVATFLGVFVGILMGAFSPFYNAIKVIVEFLRPVPTVSFLPLAILLFGLGYAMRAAVTIYAAFWPLLISTFYGVRSADPIMIETARNFGLSRRQVLQRVVLPSAVPNIATGFRISAIIALSLTITAELVAGNSGLGHFIAEMERAARYPEMYAGILLAGVIGYYLNLSFRAIEKQLLFWSPSYRNQVVEEEV